MKTNRQPSPEHKDLILKFKKHRREKDKSYGQLEIATGISRSGLHHFVNGRDRRIPKEGNFVRLVCALGGNPIHAEWIEPYLAAAASYGKDFRRTTVRRHYENLVGASNKRETPNAILPTSGQKIKAADTPPATDPTKASRAGAQPDWLSWMLLFTVVVVFSGSLLLFLHIQSAGDEAPPSYGLAEPAPKPTGPTPTAIAPTPRADMTAGDVEDSPKPASPTPTPIEPTPRANMTSGALEPTAESTRWGLATTVDPNSGASIGYIPIYQAMGQRLIAKTIPGEQWVACKVDRRGRLPEWVQVKIGDGTGYIAAKYIVTNGAVLPYCQP